MAGLRGAHRNFFLCSAMSRCSVLQEYIVVELCILCEIAPLFGVMRGYGQHLCVCEYHGYISTIFSRHVTKHSPFFDSLLGTQRFVCKAHSDRADWLTFFEKTLFSLVSVPRKNNETEIFLLLFLKLQNHPMLFGLERINGLVKIRK